MTAAAAWAFVQFLFPFIVGWFTHHGVMKLVEAQSKNETAEAKASDPAQNNDVTDLDNI